MEDYIGMIKIFAGNFAPKYWAFCDGSLLPINNNQALFSILGTTYGGNGVTNFALPDLRSRVPLGGGIGTAPNLPTYELGEMSGAPNCTLLTTEIPQHSHVPVVSSDNATVSVPVNGSSMATPGSASSGTFTASLGYNTASPDTALNSVTINVNGGSQPHNNMQPYLGISYIICLNGVFPSRS